MFSKLRVLLAGAIALGLLLILGLIGSALDARPSRGTCASGMCSLASTVSYQPAADACKCGLSCPCGDLALARYDGTLPVPKETAPAVAVEAAPVVFATTAPRKGNRIIGRIIKRRRGR